MRDPVVSPLVFILRQWSDIIITRVASRERKTDTSVGLEGDSNQYACLDVNGVTRKSDKSDECSVRSEEQVIQECKTASSKCESECSSARPNSNSTSNERTVVVSPQTRMNVQKTVTIVTGTK